MMGKNNKLDSPSRNLDMSASLPAREEFEVLCHWYTPTSTPTEFKLIDDVAHTYSCASCILLLLREPSEILVVTAADLDSTNMTASLQPEALERVTREFDDFKSLQMLALAPAAAGRQPDIREQQAATSSAASESDRGAVQRGASR